MNEIIIKTNLNTHTINTHIINTYKYIFITHRNNININKFGSREENLSEPPMFTSPKGQRRPLPAPAGAGAHTPGRDSRWGPRVFPWM